MNMRTATFGKYVLGILLLGSLLICLSCPAYAITENEKIVFEFVTNEMEMTPAAACGIMGNIEAESGFRADITGLGGAYGICQWLGPRYTRLQSWCSSNGLNYRTLQGQLQFLHFELRDTYPDVYRYLKNVSNSAQGAYDAGYYWCYHFERPGDIYNSSVRRGNIARNNYWTKVGSQAIYLTASTEENGVRLSWNYCEGSIGYRILRGSKQNGTFSMIACVYGSNQTEYLDRDTNGKTYFYYVEPIDLNSRKLKCSNRVSKTGKKSLSDEVCTMKLSKDSYTYSGKEKKPKVTVTYKKTALVLNQDYTLSYHNNTQAGTASVIVTGMGEYAGSETLTFTINKAKQTIKAQDQTISYSGSYLPISAKASGGGKLTYKVSSKSAVIKNSKIKAKMIGKIVVKIKASSTKNYLAASDTMVITVLPQKMKWKKVKDQKDGSVMLSWDPDKKVDGYQIQYGKKELLIESGKVTSVRIEQLKSGSDLTLRIRSYVNLGNRKLYGEWSKEKTIRIS